MAKPKDLDKEFTCPLSDVRTIDMATGQAIRFERHKALGRICNGGQSIHLRCGLHQFTGFINDLKIIEGILHESQSAPSS